MEKSSLVSMFTSIGVSLALIYVLKKWKESEEKLNELKSHLNISKLQISLMHHYGSTTHLPELDPIISKECLNFHEKLSTFCAEIMEAYKIPKRRILDVGSGPGSLSFHLSKHFEEVVGTDTDYEMIVKSQQLKQFARSSAEFSCEGGKHITVYPIQVPENSRRDKVTFWDENACALVYNCGRFNCVIIANTLTELEDPSKFLDEIGNYVSPNGILVIADSFYWRMGPETQIGEQTLTKDCLQCKLDKCWTFLEEKNIGFFIPKCARLAMVGNAAVSVWQRKSDIE